MPASSDTKAELRKLREVAWYFLCLKKKVCYFCGKPLLIADDFELTFGHRRHPKVYIHLTLHHIDEDRQNNTEDNLAWCHTSCHKAHHASQNQLRRKENFHAEEDVEGETPESEEAEEAEGTVRLEGGDPVQGRANHPPIEEAENVTNR